MNIGNSVNQMPVVEHDTVKSHERAEQARKEGNKCFVVKSYFDALLKYNESLCYAERGSEAIALNYANRSAVYYELKLFEKSLQNIELARQNGYPTKNIQILEKRAEKCLQQIETGNEIKKDDDPFDFIKLSDEVNVNLPFVSKSLELRRSEKFGRYIVANRDLSVGEIVAIEKPHFKIIKSDGRYAGCDGVNKFQRCALCLKSNLLDLIPCTNCSSTHIDIYSETTILHKLTTIFPFLVSIRKTRESSTCLRFYILDEACRVLRDRALYYCLTGALKPASKRCVTTIILLEDTGKLVRRRRVLWIEQRNEISSKLICVSCKDNVMNFYDFYRMVQTNQSILLEYVKKLKSIDADGVRSPRLVFTIRTTNDGAAMFNGSFEYSLNDDVKKDQKPTLIGKASQNFGIVDGDSVSMSSCVLDGNGDSMTNAEDKIVSNADSNSNNVTLFSRKNIDEKLPDHLKTRTSKEKSDAQIKEFVNLHCDICKASSQFNSFKELQEHFNFKHNQRGYVECCDKKFYRKDRLFNHITNHRDPEAFKNETLLTYLNFNIPPMFCSEECQKTAMKDFHRYECPIIDLLHKSGVMQMAMSIFFKALSIFNGSISDLEKCFNEVANSSYSVYDFNFSDSDDQAAGKNYLISLLCLAKNDKDYTKDSPEKLFNVQSELSVMWNAHSDFIKKFFLRILQIGDSNFHGICGWSLRKYDQIPQMIGIGCYPFISLVNHGCAPNVNRIYVEDKMILLVERPVKKGEQLFDCYKNTFFTQCKSDRQLMLLDNYGFLCDCIACISEYPVFHRLKSVDRAIYKRAKKAKDELLKVDGSQAKKRFRDFCDIIQKHHDKAFPSAEIVILQECILQCISTIIKPNLVIP
ncbi:SET and MYND domain-containing protein 4 [Pseudolycoriella hygida]|uniref:SET and MYND domain-containing protein 4 n=1 Tax=Pseudolycoriella hygida TaxID=35572 RepID=A0A9Q0S2I4_9DIPT|nr:SET and MYND domain-containing protein 4 [Pseudolycoriella hygida]